MWPVHRLSSRACQCLLVTKIRFIGFSILVLCVLWFSLALARSVGILAMSPLHCFIIVF